MSENSHIKETDLELHYLKTYWTGFGRRLQSIRKKSGVTAEEFAKQLGMSPVFIRQIECGAKHPSVSTLIAFARKLHVSVDELLDSEGSAELICRSEHKNPDVLRN